MWPDASFVIDSGRSASSSVRPIAPNRTRLFMKCAETPLHCAACLMNTQTWGVSLETSLDHGDGRFGSSGNYRRGIRTVPRRTGSGRGRGWSGPGRHRRRSRRRLRVAARAPAGTPSSGALLPPLWPPRADRPGPETVRPRLRTGRPRIPRRWFRGPPRRGPPWRGPPRRGSPRRGPPRRGPPRRGPAWRGRERAASRVPGPRSATWRTGSAGRCTRCIAGPRPGGGSAHPSAFPGPSGRPEWKRRTTPTGSRPGSATTAPRSDAPERAQSRQLSGRRAAFGSPSAEALPLPASARYPKRQRVSGFRKRLFPERPDVLWSGAEP